MAVHKAQLNTLNLRREIKLIKRNMKHKEKLYKHSQKSHKGKIK